MMLGSGRLVGVMMLGGMRRKSLEVAVVDGRKEGHTTDHCNPSRERLLSFPAAHWHDQYDVYSSPVLLSMGGQQRAQHLVPALGAIRATRDRHERRNRLLFDALAEDLDLVLVPPGLFFQIKE